jgi:ribosomal protein L11 methyltransferase
VIRLALRVRRADADLVLAELLELAPNGVEESQDGEVVEFAVYGAPGELPALPDLRAAAGEAFVEVRTEEIPDDWYDGWREFHRPVVVGDRLRVRPPWEPPAEDPSALVDVAIDPGMAFGTGAHASTRMCLELMLDLQPGGPFLDVGCGSGVLAVAAARLGWAPVVALDHESAAVEAARSNANANGVAVEARRWDLRRDPLPSAPTTAANLLRPLLLELADRLQAPPAQLVIGGLLTGEADEVSAAFRVRGMRERGRREEGEWAAVLLAGGPES